MIQSGNYGRGMFIKEYMRIFPATSLLLLLNIVFYFLSIFSGGNLLSGPSSPSLIFYGAQAGILVNNGQIYRMVTAIFLHGNLLHVLFNSWALYYFGMIVEGVYSSSKMLVIYLVTGLVGNVLTQIIFPNILSIGASGAIFGFVGLLFAAGLRKDISPRLARITGISLLPMIVINLFIGFSAQGINNIAHLGGLGAGFVLGYLIPPHHPVFKKSKLSWKIGMYICALIIVISIILNFVFALPPVDKFVSFSSQYADTMNELNASEDPTRYDYMLNLLKPYDLRTRQLKEMAENYVSSSGRNPTWQEIITEYNLWQKEVSEQYGSK